MFTNGIFENSLRGRSGTTFSSPQSPKNVKIKQHGFCKGIAHGTGNYTKDGNFQRAPSKRYNNVTANKSKIVANDNVKSASVSSEGFSESDSLDSLGEKIKLPPAVEDNEKNVKISSRLYNSATKASEAKMRHLDIFDMDESSWTNDLRKTETTNKNKTKKSKRRENLRKILENKLDFSRPKKSRRSNFQRLQKVEAVDFKDVMFMAENKKFIGYFSRPDISFCYKDISTILVS